MRELWILVFLCYVLCKSGSAKANSVNTNKTFSNAVGNLTEENDIKSRSAKTILLLEDLKITSTTDSSNKISENGTGSIILINNNGNNSIDKKQDIKSNTSTTVATGNENSIKRPITTFQSTIMTTPPTSISIHNNKINPVDKNQDAKRNTTINKPTTPQTTIITLTSSDNNEINLIDKRQERITTINMPTTPLTIITLIDSIGNITIDKKQDANLNTKNIGNKTAINIPTTPKTTITSTSIENNGTNNTGSKNDRKLLTTAINKSITATPTTSQTKRLIIATTHAATSINHNKINPVDKNQDAERNTTINKPSTPQTTIITSTSSENNGIDNTGSKNDKTLLTNTMNKSITATPTNSQTKRLMIEKALALTSINHNKINPVDKNQDAERNTTINKPSTPQTTIITSTSSENNGIDNTGSKNDKTLLTNTMNKSITATPTNSQTKKYMVEKALALTSINHNKINPVDKNQDAERNTTINKPSTPQTTIITSTSSENNGIDNTGSKNDKTLLTNTMNKSITATPTNSQTKRLMIEKPLALTSINAERNTTINKPKTPQTTIIKSTSSDNNEITTITTSLTIIKSIVLIDDNGINTIVKKQDANLNTTNIGNKTAINIPTTPQTTITSTSIDHNGIDTNDKESNITNIATTGYKNEITTQTTIITTPSSTSIENNEVNTIDIKYDEESNKTANNTTVNRNSTDSVTTPQTIITTPITNATITNTTITTPEPIVPPTLNVSIIGQSSTNFSIEWIVNNTRAIKIKDFVVQINPIQPSYKRRSDCPKLNYTTKYINNKTYFYNYDEAWPSYHYEVQVTARLLEPIQNITGDAQVKTNSSAPDAPYNMTYYISSNNSIANVTWQMPCNVNGNFSTFQLTVWERYTEENNKTSTSTNQTESFKIIYLKPSHYYEVHVNLLLQEDIRGPFSSTKFTTEVGFPGTPLPWNSNVSNTSFIIEWKEPELKTGPIKFYELNITNLRPLYNVPYNCNWYPSNQEFAIKGNGDKTFIFNNTLPYNEYEVEIRANTTKGYGNSSRIRINTTTGVPENIRNIKFSFNSTLTEEYDARVLIDFESPCNVFGEFKNYMLEYIGTREGHTTVNGSLHTFDSSFSFELRPEYNYTYFIKTKNEMFENISSTHSFQAPPGVPNINKNESSIPINSVSQGQAQIILKKSYFNSTNGEFKYIALILSETRRGASTNSPQRWNSSQWPTSDEGIQLTDCFWQPFNTSDETTFIIGNGSYCNSTCGCNSRLKDETEYFLTIRVFNQIFYRDGKPVSFRTEGVSNVAQTVGIIMGILIFALFGMAAFLIWKKQLYKKLPHIYPLKLNSKPPEQSHKSLLPKKFIQYYKHTQNKPDILKTQFIELAEKSKEIQSEKCTHFAQLLENKRKNRYVNILPYDDTRVKLLIDEDDEIGSDYINASHIKGNSGNVEYIASQGPLLSTCRDFWKMVIQENVTIIVMVSQFIEKNKDKCYKYFPKNHENLVVDDDMEIRCSTELHFGTYLIRNLQVRKDTLQITVTHMQFLEWPDFNVPSSTEHLLQFIYQLRERVRIEEGLIIVHCSAGVGRTGTLIAADILLQKVNAGKQIDVFNTVLELRQQRIMMVQTMEQYIYLHRLVADHIDRPPTPDLMEESDPVYENMDMIQKQSEDESATKQQESQF